MTRLTVRLFGGFSFVVDGCAVEPPSTAKARAIVAYLIASRDRSVARERLAEIFWPESDGDRARSSVGTALWAIRRALRSARLDPDMYLTADTLAIAWRGEVVCDVLDFEHMAREDPARAVDLYGGLFLDGIYDEWTVRERERLDALYEAVLTRSLGAGGPHDGEEHARERNARLIVERNPYSEDAWSTLIERSVQQGALVAARATLARALACFAEAGMAVSTGFADRFRSLADHALAPERLPFVGRDRELQRVLAALRSPAASGAVVVVGQAGIGKTEFLRHVAALLEGAGRRIVWIVPQHRRFALHALEAVAARAAGRTIDELQAESSERRSSIVAAALAGDAAATYVIDDFHWADGDVREIIAELTCFPGRAVVATRPEGRAALHADPRGTPADIVELHALDRASVAAALRRLPLTDAERERLYTISGGYPLTLDALLRMPAGTDASAHVPDIARLLLERRLDERGELPSRAASLLALEPTLAGAQVAQLLDAPLERVLDAFDDLFAMGIIVDRHDGPAFCHDLFAEVAAHRIAPVRRRALHARIAEIIGPDADPARYALHLARARRPLDAAHAYLRAAEAQFARGAFHDARELLEAGLAALGEHGGAVATDVRIALRIELARALADSGRQDAAVTALVHACAEARAARRDELLLRALLIKSRLGIEMASVRGAECDESDLDEALVLAGRLPATLASVQALGLAARGIMNRRLDAADRYAASALALARRLDAPEPLAEALQASATIALLRWDIARAIEETAELVAVAQRIGTVRASRATGLHGVCHLMAQRYTDAEMFGRKALALATEALPDDDLLRVSRWRLETTALELLTCVELQHGTGGAVAWARRRAAVTVESIGDRCEAATILSLVLLAQPQPTHAELAEAESSIAPYVADHTAIVRVYMLRIAQALLAAARHDPATERCVVDAWEACRELPAEETLTLDYWLLPLARAARRAGLREIANTMFVHSREVVRRRRRGSGEWWRPTVREAFGFERRVS